MTARTIRRAQERRAKKLARKQAQAEPTCFDRIQESSESPDAAPEISPARLAANRANAQHSTGPRTTEGKTRSAKNSFRHGLYSKQLILPNECAAEFDELRAALRAEHQPATVTAEILVDELAGHYWRMRRFRSMETKCWIPESLDGACDSGLMALVQRSLASAERSFHKTLAALRQLKKDEAAAEKQQPAVPETAALKTVAASPGFVPSFLDDDLATTPTGHVDIEVYPAAPPLLTPGF